MKTSGKWGLCAAAVLAVCAAGSVRAQSTCSIAPKVRATIVRYPDANNTFIITSNGLASAYFKTTFSNRRFDRSFLEFKLPSYGLNVSSGVLKLFEDGGSILAPTPPDTHEVAYYDDTAGVDFAVTLDDYDRPLNTTVATFQSDANLSSEQFTVDLTGAINQASRPGFGLRIKLANDPGENAFTNYGTSFSLTSSLPPPHLELTLPAGALPCEPVVQILGTPSGTRISWTATQGALDYDVAYGSVQTLKASRSLVSSQCAADNLAADQLDFSLVPPIGDAYWFLVRDNDAVSCRSYGGNLVQQVRRDDQINACPCQ